jgi:hypothetical protein
VGATPLPALISRSTRRSWSRDDAAEHVLRAHTEILLVPSAVNESFGRVAAKASINGIPPVVSDRGALPERCVAPEEC